MQSMCLDDNGNEIDVGNLDAIFAAIEHTTRREPFEIPTRLRRDRHEIAELPVKRRRERYFPRLVLRGSIDRTKRSYRLRKRINSLPWATINRQIARIDKHLHALRKLLPKHKKTDEDHLSDADAGIWCSEAFPELSVFVHSDEANVATHLGGKEIERETPQSARDWLVLQLAKVFKNYLGAEPTTAWDEHKSQYYSTPFTAFVIEVAKELGMEIKLSTIHRIMTTKPGMHRRQGKRRKGGALSRRRKLL
jgi:hypothetical protein